MPFLHKYPDLEVNNKLHAFKSIISAENVKFIKCLKGHAQA